MQKTNVAGWGYHGLPGLSMRNLRLQGLLALGDSTALQNSCKESWPNCLPQLTFLHGPGCLCRCHSGSFARLLLGRLLIRTTLRVGVPWFVYTSSLASAGQQNEVSLTCFTNQTKAILDAVFARDILSLADTFSTAEPCTVDIF